MGVFHWGRLGFFDSWEKGLQSRIGLVVVSLLVMVDRQNTKHV